MTARAAARSATLQQLAGKPVAPTPAQTAAATKEAQIFLERFAGATGSHLAAERFDYDAARLWAKSEIAPVMSDQSSLIRRLLSRRKSTVSTPLVTSHEEQDPYYGRFGLSTLIDPRYGKFQLVNGNYIHFNEQPPTLPPRPHRVHLCWGVGWAGATLDRPRAEGEMGEVTGASVLQHVAGLIADDWRSALSPLPVHLDLHRMNPNPCAIDAAPSRRRWKQTRPPVPPPRIVGTLFERANYAETLGTWRLRRTDADLAATSTAPRREWWCALLLEADLPYLRFVRGAESMLARAAQWTATSTTLPAEIEHVIVVPLLPDEGQFYRVNRSQTRVTLEPQPNTRPRVQLKDYWNLRVAALDLALNELAARMD